jgi:hypothetical protein
MHSILYEKEIELENSGNEVYYAACFLLVILKNSYSKFHCQNFYLIPDQSQRDIAGRCRAKRKHLERFQGLSPKSQDQNLVLTVSYVPSLIADSGQKRLLVTEALHPHQEKAATSSFPFQY